MLSRSPSHFQPSMLWFDFLNLSLNCSKCLCLCLLIGHAISPDQLSERTYESTTDLRLFLTTLKSKVAHRLTDSQTPIELTRLNTTAMTDTYCPYDRHILPVWDVSKCVNCQKLGQEAVHFQQARIISRTRNWAAALEVVLNSQLLPKSVISRHWQSGFMDAIAEFCIMWAIDTL